MRGFWQRYSEASPMHAFTIVSLAVVGAWAVGVALVFVIPGIVSQFY